MKNIKSIAAGICLGVAVIILNATPSRAVPITFQYTAIVTAINGGSGLRLDTTGIVVGSTIISGMMSYDLNQPAVLNGAGFSLYDFASGTAVLPNQVVAIDPSTPNYALGRGAVGVFNSSSDSFQIQPEALINSPPASDTFAISITLTDSTGTVFNNTALPNSLNFGDFDSSFFQLRDARSGFSIPSDNGSTEIQGTLLSFTAVPEPGTLALFGFGLAGLGLTRRRKAS